MQSFPEALAQRLGPRVQTDATVERLSRHAEGFEVTYRQGNALCRQRTRCVVLAVPADAAESYMQMCNPGIEWGLADLDYAPVAQVFLGFPRACVQHPLNGFGMLMPQSEHRRLLGSLWTSSLFPGRAPPDRLALTCFLGGVRRPDLVKLDAAQLLAITLDELTPLLGLRGAPEVVRLQVWPRAIPQYNLGYERLVARMNAFEATTPGVFLCGNFRGGIAVGDCVMQAARIADRVVAFLQAIP